VHRFYQHQDQINGVRMDRLVAWTNVGGLVMSSYDSELRGVDVPNAWSGVEVTDRRGAVVAHRLAGSQAPQHMR